MSAQTFGALARRNQHRQETYGFHPFPGFPVCIRLVLISRGAGTHETVRVRFESVLRGTRIKDTDVDPKTIIDWWCEPAYDPILRAFLIHTPLELENPQVFVLNGNCEMVPQ